MKSRILNRQKYFVDLTMIDKTPHCNRAVTKNDDRSRRAFTLVELLVVIAIIGILVALLLPAINSAREASRKTKCLNSQRQLALACNAFLEANKRFPVGQYSYIDDHWPVPAAVPAIGTKYPRRCWFEEMMPYFEDRALNQMYEAWFKTKLGTTTVDTASYDFPQGNRVVPMLVCPSDPNSPKLVTWSGGANGSQGFSANMVLCTGNTYMNPNRDPKNSAKLNGIFFANSKLKVRDITDGIAKTAMVSELVVCPDDSVSGDDVRGRYYNSPHGNTLFSTLRQPNPAEPDQFYWANKTVSLKLRIPSVWSDQAPAATIGYIVISPRSNHPGGVNLCMADGSGKFISEDINLRVFQAMGSRNGRENIPEF